jgi:hypothetical protein
VPQVTFLGYVMNPLRLTVFLTLFIDLRCLTIILLFFHQ